MTKHNPEAFLVVMAVDDKTSLGQAERILAYLRMSGMMEEKTVILVANKTDLVRNRVVKPMEGKNLAVTFKIKYIETSPGENIKMLITPDNLHDHHHRDQPQRG